jgi:hypothetical protein
MLVEDLHLQYQLQEGNGEKAIPATPKKVLIFPYYFRGLKGLSPRIDQPESGTNAKALFCLPNSHEPYYTVETPNRSLNIKCMVPPILETGL